MNKFLPVDEQMDLLEKGAAEIIRVSELRERLEKSRQTGVPLRVKAGFDPSAPDIHLGHTVLLHKMRHFQDLGAHQARYTSDRRRCQHQSRWKQVDQAIRQVKASITTGGQCIHSPGWNGRQAPLSKFHRQQQDRYQAQPETGHRVKDDRQDP